MNRKKALLTLILATSLLFSCGKKKNTSKQESSSSIESSVVSESSTIVDSSSSSSEQPVADLSNIYDGYYQDIEWTDGEDLRAKLHTAMRKNYKAIPYAGTTTNWESNQCADQALEDFECVDVVYSATNDLKTATNSNGSGWQREHAFPACLMTGSQTGSAVKNLGRATDFHNLFASFYSGNTSRGNKNYGTANTASMSYQNLSTNNGEDGYKCDEKNFEPGTKDKGRLSRAIFYMATMYMYDEVDSKNNITMKGLNVQEDYVSFSSSTAYSTYAIGNLSTLLEWSKIPVDRLEYQHAESVRTHQIEGVAQGNRNAFVDFPELVDYVYGSKKTEPGKLSDLIPTETTLDVKSKDLANYAIEKAKRKYLVGETVKKEDFTIVSVAKDYSLSASAIDIQFEALAYTSADIGTKMVTLTTPTGNITYTVQVTDASLESCSWKYTFANKSAFGETGTKILSTGTTVTLNGLQWEFSFNNPTNTSGSIPVGNSSNFGGCISIGTGSSNNWAQTLTMKSKVELTNVDAIYVKANTAANQTYYLSASIGEEKVISQKAIKRDASQCSIVGDRFEAKTGIVTITLTSVSAAFYFQQIGINYSI